MLPCRLVPLATYVPSRYFEVAADGSPDTGGVVLRTAGALGVGVAELDPPVGGLAVGRAVNPPGVPVARRGARVGGAAAARAAVVGVAVNAASDGCVRR
jgi:hypothetical protein